MIIRVAADVGELFDGFDLYNDPVIAKKIGDVFLSEDSILVGELQFWFGNEWNRLWFKFNA